MMKKNQLFFVRVTMVIYVISYCLIYRKIEKKNKKNQLQNKKKVIK
jgi:hypothetical protein